MRQKKLQNSKVKVEKIFAACSVMYRKEKNTIKKMIYSKNAQILCHGHLNFQCLYLLSCMRQSMFYILALNPFLSIHCSLCIDVKIASQSVQTKNKDLNMQNLLHVSILSLQSTQWLTHLQGVCTYCS